MNNAVWSKGNMAPINRGIWRVTYPEEHKGRRVYISLVTKE
jgi:hypothetical protein